MKQNRKQPKATARNSRGPPASFPEQPPQQRQQRAHDQAGHNGKMERSEEHTSELQSLRHLVCRLLLEKTKRRRTAPGKSGSKSTVPYPRSSAAAGRGSLRPPSRAAIFFNDTATTEIYPLPLPDPLPI